MTIRVLLVDDHRLVREALRDALAKVSDIEVVGEAGDAHTALEQTRVLKPDVAVIDIGLPDLNGMELTARLKEADANVKVVALSAYTDKRFVTEMLRCGASGYVIKASAGTELLRAIRAVTGGQSYLCPEITEALVAEVRDSEAGKEVPRLARREREVLRLIAQGMRSQAIGEQLHVSVATVEVHRRNIMRKLGLHTIAELTKYAIREGIASL
ncbi:MAG TPA: response regulator transcription factor [Steroidobacteraceae bacterium]|nr:response regulator transcription factor [Steroidobacteraceae bacterium]